MEFSKQIKKYRLDSNLSQDELAEKVYVTRQTISFLIDYPKLIGLWFVKGLLCKQC